MSVNVGSATGYLDLDISGFLASLKTAQSESQKTTQNIATKTATSMKSVGSKLTSAGGMLTKSVTVPIVGIGAAIIKTGADFEKGMSKVQAVSGASSSDMEKLSAKARQMGKDTKFSASESADAFTYMAMAGWKTNDMLEGIDGIMSLSAADGLDLATTSDIVTDAITAFGLEAKDSSHFADVLAKASSSANTNVSMLGESFKYCAPVAGALGYSVEDVSIALGTMANSGIKASQGGTALRTLLTNMAKPTDAMAAAMDELGVSLDDGHGNMKSLREVMNDLRKGMGNMKMPQEEFNKQMAYLNQELESGNITQKKYDKSVEHLTEKAYGAEGALKAQAAATLAGKTGMSGLLAIVNSSEEDWNNLTNAIDNSDGTAKNMADTMLNNLSGQFIILKSNLQEAALQLNEELGPAMKKIVDKIQEWVQKFMALSPQQKEMIVKIAAVAAVIGPLLMVVGKLTSSMGSIISVASKVPGAFSKAKGAASALSTGMTNLKEGFVLAKAGMPGLGAQASKLGAALGGITAPIAAVIAVIAILVAAFATLWKTNEKFRNKIKEIWGQIKDTISDFCQGIVDRVNELGFNFKDITDLLWSIWKGFCDLLAPVFEGVFQNIANTIKFVLDTILGIVDIFIGIFTGDWDKVWTGIKEVFTSVWNYIVGFFSNIWNTLKGIIDTVLGWFGTSLSSVWTSIKNFFVNTWNNIVTGVSNFVSSIVNFFVSLPGKIAGFFSSIWTTIVNFVTGLPAKAAEIGTNFINAVVGFFSELPYKIGYAIGAVLGTIARWVVNMVNKVRTTVPKIISAVIKFFKELPGKIWNAIVSAVTGIAKWATNMKNKAVNGIKTLVSSVVNWFKKLPGRIWNAIVSAVTGIAKWANEMRNKAVNGVKNLISSVINWFKKLPGRIWNAIVSAVTGIAKWTTDMKNKAVSGIKKVASAVVDGFKALPGKIKDIGSNLVKGLWNGIKNAKDWILDKVKGFGDGILKGFKDFFGIHSPSKVMKEQVGANIALGVIEGIKSKKKNAKKSAEQLGQLYVTAAQNKLETLKGKNKLSLAEEIKYWKEIRKHTKAGTSAYTQANKKIKNVQKDYIKNAEDELKKKKQTNKVSLQDEVNYWKNIQKGLKKGTKAYKDATQNMKAAKKKLNDSLKKLNDEYAADVAKVQKKLTEDINNVMAEYDNAVNDRAKSIASSMGLFDKFESTTENTKESLTENLRSQVKGIKDWTTALDTLSKRNVDPEFIKELQEMGPSALSDVQLLVSMSGQELDEYVSLWRQKNSAAVTQALTEVDKQEYLDQIKELINEANTELNTLEKEYKKNLKSFGVAAKDTSKKVGKQIVAGLKKGVKSDFPGFLEYIKDSLGKVTSTAKKALGIKSPSRVFQSIGKFMTAGLSIGFVNGMQGVQKDVKEEVEGLADVDATANVGIDNSFLQMIETLKATYSEMQIWFDSFDTRLLKTFDILQYNLRLLMQTLKMVINPSMSFNDEFGYVSRSGFGRNPNNSVVVDDGNNPNAGGDTFNFYSPKPIDEIEAARQMKKAKRDLAEGF